MTNFHPINFCSFDTFSRNTLMQQNSKLNSKSHDNLYKHCLLAEKFAYRDYFMESAYVRDFHTSW